MLPNFVIIGAQKSASSFLHSCLNDHPDCFLPEDEIPFFESPDYENSTLSALEKHFENRSEKCLGIKRPNYIGKPEVPKRILHHLPNAKLIAVLRNPVERTISAYYHYINGGYIPGMDIETGMRKLLGESSFQEQYKRSHEILEFGYYYKYLSQYQDYYNNRKLFILLHDEVLETPLERIQQVYQFLGLDSSFVPPSLQSSPQKVTYNLAYVKLLSSVRNQLLYVYNEDKTRRYPRKLSQWQKQVIKAIKMLNTAILGKLLPNKKPKVSFHLKKEIYEHYKSDIKSLEMFLGRSLEHWRLE